MPRVAVALLTLLGTALIARSATFYRGEDALALVVLGCIAAGLWVGAIELWRRASAAERLLREVAGLPAADAADLEPALAAASPAIRARIAAARAGQPPPGPPVGFTPYLVGLLVMMGLFGTFLGLVETLAGARGAMLGAADVTALRQGLAGPIDGLTRAFGTSVAGVAASAALGLAAVWVRRAERRSRRRLSGWAGIALAAVTPAGRQLAVLEALARQGDALPAAAEALSRAVARIEHLESSLVAAQDAVGERAAGAHESAARAAAAAFEGAADQIRQSLGEGFARSVEKTTAAVAELAGAAAARAEAAVGQHAGQWTAQLTADGEARRAADAAHRAALTAEAERSRAALGEGFERLMAAVEQAEEGRALADEVRAEALSTHAAGLAERLAEAERARLGALAGLVAQLDGRLQAADEERARRWQSLAERIEQQAEDDRSARAADEDRRDQRHAVLLGRMDDAEVARAQAWSAAAAGIAERHVTLVDELAAREADRSAAETTRQAALLDRFEDAARQRAEADGMLVAHIEAMLTTVEGAEARRGEQATARDTTAHGRHADLLDRLDALVRRQAEADTSLRAHVEAAHAALLEQLETAEGARAISRANEWAATVDRVEQADARRQAEAEAAVARQTAALGDLAGRIDAADSRRVDAWAEAAEAQQAALDALASRIEAAGSARDAHAQEMSAADRAALSALGERLAAANAAVEATHRQALADLIARFEALDAARSDRSAASAASQAEALTALAARLEQTATERVEGVVSRLDRAVDATRDGLAAIGAPLAALVADVQTAVAQLTEAEQDRAAALAERLDALVQRVESRLLDTAEADAGRLRAFGEAVDGARQHLEHAAIQSARQAESIGARFEAVQAALADLDVQTAERLEATTIRLGAALAAQAEAFAAAQSARATEAAAVLVRLDTALEQHLSAMGERLSTPLAEVAAAAAEAPAAAARLVEAAAARLAEQSAADTARDSRLDGLIDGMARTVERMDAATEARFAAAEASEESAGARLAALAEQVELILSRQSERLVAFEQRMAQERIASAEALASTLSAQAAELGAQLAEAGAGVRSGADLLTAGGAELSAVAQMLAEAVDGYREANERWMTTLAELEGRFGDSGEDQAGRLVGEYLDQTREVFGDALRFQRELFTELRALRGEAPAGAAG